MTGNLLYYEGNFAGLAEAGKKGTSVVVGRAADAEMCADRTAEAAVAGMADMLRVYAVEASDMADTAEPEALMQNGDAEGFGENEEVEDMVGQSRRGTPGSDLL
uniref:Uncharacterized protein n=1 Tax=Fusarium oxysporum (strain Fo5176) TaxID=660025 RepID=A0A0D2XMY7_FUSOF